MRKLLRELWHEEEGQDLTEYALLIVLIALIAVVSIGTIGDAISDVLSNAAKNLTTTTT
jgi:Flp pilus assembly pilin Flp